MHRGMLLAVVGLVVLSSVGGVTAASSITQEERTLSGTVFPPPADLDASALEAVQAAAESWGYTTPTEVAFLYTDDGTPYLVGFTSEFAPGRYTLKGATATPSETDSRYGIMIPTSVEKHQPQRVDYEKLRQNPERYRNQHVVTDANNSAVAFRFDTEGVSSQQTVGAIGGSGGPTDLLSQPGRAARYTLFNATSRDGASVIQAREGGIVRSYLAAGGNANVSFSHHERRFWTDTDGELRLLVLPKEAPTEYNARIYYSTAVRPQGIPVASVADISANPDVYEGEVVLVNGTAVGSAVSAQESLLAVAECAPESVTVPATPPFCAPVPADVVAHTGAVFDRSDPQAAVAYVGLSNSIQEQPVTAERGEYVMVGRVVSADKVAPRLNASVAIVVMDRQRVGDLTVSSSDLATADRLAGKVRRVIRSQMTLDSAEYREQVAAAQATPTPTAMPSPPPTATPTPMPTATPTDSRTKENEADDGSGDTATPIRDYALYDLMDARLNKQTVAPGEPITATLVVRNPDPIELETTITVAFGFEEIEKEITIPAESTKSVEFTYNGVERREGDFSVILVRLTGGSYDIGEVDIVPRSTQSPTDAAGPGFGTTSAVVGLLVLVLISRNVI